MIATGRSFQDLGSDYFDKLREGSLVRSLKRRIERLGYEVALEKPGEALPEDDVGPAASELDDVA